MGKETTVLYQGEGRGIPDSYQNAEEGRACTRG